MIIFIICVIPVFIMQLTQHCLELLRHGQSQVRGVLQQADAFVAKVEAYDGASQRGACAHQMCVQHVPYAYQREYKVFYFGMFFS